jgi:hypothetical protein
MGSLKRKMQRKKLLKARKEATKAMSAVSKQVDSMPKHCGECGTTFEMADKETIDQWKIAVWEDGRIYLSCPRCYEKNMSKS